MNIQEVLKQVQEGTLSVEQAEAMLRKDHFAGKMLQKRLLRKMILRKWDMTNWIPTSKRARIRGSCVLQRKEYGTVGVHLSSYL